MQVTLKNDKTSRAYNPVYSVVEGGGKDMALLFDAGDTALVVECFWDGREFTFDKIIERRPVLATEWVGQDGHPREVYSPGTMLRIILSGDQVIYERKSDRSKSNDGTAADDGAGGDTNAPAEGGSGGTGRKPAKSSRKAKR